MQVKFLSADNDPNLEYLLLKHPAPSQLECRPLWLQTSILRWCDVNLYDLPHVALDDHSSVAMTPKTGSRHVTKAFMTWNISSGFTSSCWHRSHHHVTRNLVTEENCWQFWVVWKWISTQNLSLGIRLVLIRSKFTAWRHGLQWPPPHPKHFRNLNFWFLSEDSLAKYLHTKKMIHSDISNCLLKTLPSCPPCPQPCYLCKHCMSVGSPSVKKNVHWIHLVFMKIFTLTT